MEFKKDIVILLGQCIEDSAVTIDKNGNKVRQFTLQESSGKNNNGVGNIIKVIDSTNLAVEMLYSYDKFIEIFDKHGFSGFVS